MLRKKCRWGKVELAGTTAGHKKTVSSPATIGYNRGKSPVREPSKVRRATRGSPRRPTLTPPQKAMLRSAIVLIPLLVPLSLSASEPSHIVFQSIRRGDHQLLANLLQQATPANLRADDGTTPLAYAALWGDQRMVQLLLDAGADPNAANRHGATALIYGAGDLGKVQSLLRADADPNAKSKLGNTPLIVAAAYPQSTSVIELLLAHGAELDATNNRGNTALRNAITVGDLKTVKLLLLHGAAINGGRNATSDLAVAAERGHLEIVQLLLDHGADVNAKGGRHALHAALLAQKPAIARLLLKHGAQLDRRLSPGDVPTIVLSAYTEFGDTTVAREMIKLAPDLDATNEYHESAVVWAHRRGHQELIDLLREAGAAEAAATDETSSSRDDSTATGLQPQLAAAVSKSIALLQHSSDVFLEKRDSCVSCHHQNLPAVSVGWARDRGLSVDRESIERMVEAQLRSWRPRIQRAYQMDRPVPVEPRFIGYGLLGFAALGYPADEVTDAMVWYLANIQQPDGHWVPGMLRPPLGGAEIVATVLAMRSLQLYPAAGRRAEMIDRVARAKSWLQAAKPRTHQERVYRLMGLAWSGVPSSELVDVVSGLVAEQRPDGGWAQLPRLNSDAWATGQTLVALRVAGGLPTSHAACQRGVEFLLRTQAEDGSWHVPHRSWPFQAYFDSEFPYERDQWVSAPATAWATMALTLAIDRSSTEAVVTSGGAAPDRKKTAEQHGPIDFVEQIQPILAKSCVACHSGENPEGGFLLTGRAALLAGGDSGQPAVVPGKSDEGLLIRFVSDAVDDFEMPPIGKRRRYPALTQQQIGLLRTWIERGAEWPEDVVLGK